MAAMFVAVLYSNLAVSRGAAPYVKNRLAELPVQKVGVLLGLVDTPPALPTSTTTASQTSTKAGTVDGATTGATTGAAPGLILLAPGDTTMADSLTSTTTVSQTSMRAGTTGATAGATTGATTGTTGGNHDKSHKSFKQIFFLRQSFLVASSTSPCENGALLIGSRLCQAVGRRLRC